MEGRHTLKDREKAIKDLKKYYPDLDFAVSEMNV